MRGQFTLNDYSNNEHFKNPHVVVSDRRSDSDMVYITIKDKVVKVNCKEMI